MKSFHDGHIKIGQKLLCEFNQRYILCEAINSVLHRLYDEDFDRPVHIIICESADAIQLGLDNTYCTVPLRRIDLSEAGLILGECIANKNDNQLGEKTLERAQQMKKGVEGIFSRRVKSVNQRRLRWCRHKLKQNAAPDDEKKGAIMTAHFAKEHSLMRSSRKKLSLKDFSLKARHWLVLWFVQEFQDAVEQRVEIPSDISNLIVRFSKIDKRLLICVMSVAQSGRTSTSYYWRRARFQGRTNYSDSELEVANRFVRLLSVICCSVCQERAGWSQGDKVEVFSNTDREWYPGVIWRAFEDDEGDWLLCQCRRFSKQLGRFSTDVRPYMELEPSGTVCCLQGH